MFTTRLVIGLFICVSIQLDILSYGNDNNTFEIIGCFNITSLPREQINCVYYLFDTVFFAIVC